MNNYEQQWFYMVLKFTIAYRSYNDKEMCKVSVIGPETVNL